MTQKSLSLKLNAGRAKRHHSVFRGRVVGPGGGGGGGLAAGGGRGEFNFLVGAIMRV